MTSWILALLLQSSVLIYHDVYSATQPCNEWAKSIDGRDCEANPAAAMFTKKSEYNGLYWSAVGLNTTAIMVLPYLQKQLKLQISPEIMQGLYLTGLIMAETWAINEWVKEFGWVDFKTHMIVYQTAF